MFVNWSEIRVLGWPPSGADTAPLPRSIPGVWESGRTCWPRGSPRRGRGSAFWPRSGGGGDWPDRRAAAPSYPSQSGQRPCARARSIRRARWWNVERPDCKIEEVENCINYEYSNLFNIFFTNTLFICNSSIHWRTDCLIGCSLDWLIDWWMDGWMDGWVEVCKEKEEERRPVQTNIPIIKSSHSLRANIVNNHHFTV